MRRALSIILTFAAAVLVVAALRVAIFAVVTVSQPGQEPLLLQGDRVLVKRWTYGLRYSWRDEYHRFHPVQPGKGDLIVFNTPAVERGARPDTSSLCMGQVLACPGDTVWLGPKGRISATRNYRKGCIWPLVVPARGAQVHTNPWNFSLYAFTIRQHESENDVLLYDTLLESGRLPASYRFQYNYYWVYSGNEANLSDSRTYGFVPEPFIMGQACTVLYSLDPARPWYRRIRRRFFQPIGDRK